MSEPAADPDREDFASHPPLDGVAIASAIDAREAGKVGGGMAWRVEVVEETASTNDLALARGAGGEPEGWCVFAERQTAGRGRRGDPWLSPGRRDLLFSILLRPRAPMSQWPRLPQLAAVALCRAIDRLAPALRVQAQIKWPNDIWLSGKKVAGLLVDTRTQGGGAYAVLGIGLNVNGVAFAEELRAIATSLRLAADGGGGVVFDRSMLAASVLGEFGRLYPAGLSDRGFAEVRDILHERSCLLGHPVTVESAAGPMRGEVVGFGESGEMILRTEQGQEKVLHSADQVRLVSGLESN